MVARFAGGLNPEMDVVKRRFEVSCGEDLIGSTKVEQSSIEARCTE